MIIRQWWNRQWGNDMNPNHEIDDLRADLRRAEAENQRVGDDVLELQEAERRALDTVGHLMQTNMEQQETISILRTANEEATAEIERLTKRLASVERISEIRGQCRDDAYAAMAKDSVP